MRRGTRASPMRGHSRNPGKALNVADFHVGELFDPLHLGVGMVCNQLPPAAAIGKRAHQLHAQILKVFYALHLDVRERVDDLNTAV